MRAAQLGRGPSLALEPLDRHGLQRLDPRDQLHGDVDLELEVARDPDRAHAAGAERALEAILAGEEGAARG